MSHPKTANALTRYALVLLLSIATACSRSPEPQQSPAQRSAISTRHVTFVQWTDPHVFDAGKGRSSEGVREEELDNWAAFHWAVLETNRLVLSEHRDIDFVVITGDFGLENVLLNNETNVPSCPGNKAGDDEGPIPAVPMAVAAEEVGRELDASLVKRVYLIPGNNDLACENPKDLPRWTQFVSALQQNLAARDQERNNGVKAVQKQPNAATAVEVVDLTSVADPPVNNGISLLGLDSAYFKNHEIDRSKQKQASANPSGKSAVTKDTRGIDPASKLIQDAGDAAIPKEVDRVSKQIQPGGSYLVFTHIPDLNDPFSRAASWKLPDKALDDWKANILDKTDVLGIFAGHFHTADRSLFPQNFAKLMDQSADKNIAVKLWLAPPLAEKYQWRSPPEETARGMLLVSVNADGQTRVAAADADVKASAMWFSTSDQNTAAASVGDDKTAQARADERDGNWPQAATNYQNVVGNDKADARTRATALSGYLHAREKMRSWWWQSTVARWFYLNGTALVVSLALILLAFTAYSLLRWTPVLDKTKDILKSIVVPAYKGRVTISDTIKLTTNAPAEEFGALLKAEGEEIRRRLQREQENWAAGQISLLAPSGNSLDSLVSSIPKVEKVDVSALMKFLVNLLQFFRWTVQTGLAVIPPNQISQPTAGATATTPTDGVVPKAELNAYAVLQWGWVVRKSWWRKRTVEGDRSAMRDLARELAELISGEAFVRR